MQSMVHKDADPRVALGEVALLATHACEGVEVTGQCGARGHAHGRKDALQGM